MKRALIGAALIVGVVSAGLVASAQRRRPPAEAYEACAGRSEGDRCEVDTPRGKMEGTCRFLSEGEELVCYPDKLGNRKTTQR